jgi:hypothetical protein
MGTNLEGGMQLTAPSYPRGLILGDDSEPLQSVVETSTTPQYHLGTKLWYADGDIFRYAYNGGVALAKALMTCSASNTANCVAETQATSGTSVEIGDREIVIDVTNASGITDDLYADGKVVIETGTAIGDSYLILACKLLTTTTARLLLKHPIRTAWAADTVISLVRNRFKEVVVGPTTLTREPTGVPLIAVPINYYCWLQTGGLCGLMVDTGDNIVPGNNVGSPGTHAVAGACGVQTAGTFPEWGVCVTEPSGDQVATIHLTLDT